ncbi:hypothetical protein KUTeg_016200 [Tegillarca granosa]|uniref:Ferric-chelate reductase 1 n=1 Tax=Tegillarca granosa TaxID=220873 RepID=A0ABQ9EQH3_TEGGR|nr:hypothetical protein KUTeg_016200 [Tegillarca granosa]
MQLALLLLLFMHGKLAEGYSHGAPSSTCIDMEPHHSGSMAMRSPPPFEILIKSSTMTYAPGEQFQVVVRPKVVGASFVGFLIKAGSRTRRFAGTFLTLPLGAKYVQCPFPDAGDKQVITHSTRVVRPGQQESQLTFIWQAPPGNAGDILIRATIVKGYQEYWMDVDSPILRYRAPQPQPGPQQLPGQNQQNNPQQGGIQSVRPNTIQENIPGLPQPPQLLPGNPQQPQMVPIHPTQNVIPQHPSQWQIQHPQQIHPSQQQPFHPQALPPLQPAQLPPLQPQPLPPFQPNQPQSPFQNPFQRPPQQHQEHVPLLRTLPAFTPPATKAPTTSILRKDPECDVTKGCHNVCTNDDCQHTITWKDNVDHVEFDLAAKVPAGDRWIAIAFSDDLKMDNDEVIECVGNNGDVNVFHSFNFGKSNRRSSDDKLGLSNTEGSLVNGILRCKFRRSKQTGQQTNNELFDLDKDWHLMFGTGPATSGFQLRMHGEIPMVTANRIDFQAVSKRQAGQEPQEQTTLVATTKQPPQGPVNVAKLAQDKSCGKTKGCYTVDKYTVSWRDTDLFTDFEVSARIPNTGNQWTAIAFSEDLKMGDDEVIECVSSDEKVDVFRSWNHGKENRRIIDSKHGLLNTMGSFKDGVFSCGFRRIKNPIRSKRSAGDNEEGIKIMDLDKTWHLMIGSGPASTNYEKRMHTSNPLVSPSKIPKIPGKEYTQAHPILGIIVTLLCVGNPIMALFRPGPKDSNRPLFNWAHWAVGMLAHVLSVITICFGIEMNKSPTPEYAVWVVVGYVVYHLTMEVLLKTFDVCSDRPDSNKNTAYEMKNKTTTENGNGTQPPTYAEVIPKNKRDPKMSQHFKNSEF